MILGGGGGFTVLKPFKNLKRCAPLPELGWAEMSWAGYGQVPAARASLSYFWWASCRYTSRSSHRRGNGQILGGFGGSEVSGRFREGFREVWTAQRFRKVFGRFSGGLDLRIIS